MSVCLWQYKIVFIITIPVAEETIIYTTQHDEKHVFLADWLSQKTDQIIIITMPV